MRSKLIKMIDLIREDTNPETKLGIEEKEKAFWRMAFLYRLRFHEPFLINIEPVLKKMTDVVEQKYPDFGGKLRDIFYEVFNNQKNAKELLDLISKKFKIDYRSPATDIEEGIIKVINEASSDMASGGSTLEEKVFSFLLDPNGDN